MNQIVPITTPQRPHFPISNEVNQLNTAAKRTVTAKRLANTKNMDYQEWLEVRNQGIGSSDAATACGLNPYMSMLELWMIKTGRVQQNIDDDSSGLKYTVRREWMCWRSTFLNRIRVGRWSNILRLKGLCRIFSRACSKV